MYLDNYCLRIQYLINNKLNLISTNPNIVGMGLGYKRINSNNINIPTLTFLVKKKLPPTLLSPNNIIPKYFNGILTDVIESGNFNTCAGEKPTRPIVGGVSIQNPVNKYWGTSGYAVTERDSKNTLYLLTAGHILRSDDPSARVYIIQPKYQPGEELGSRDKEKLGKLYIINQIAIPKSEDTPLPTEYNTYDIGFLSLGENTPDNKKRLLGPGFFDGSKATGVIPVNKDGIVQISPNALNPTPITMYGAASGKINGGVLLNPFTFKASYKKAGGLKGKVAYFRNQVAAQIKADFGDSGAIGISNKDKKAFGLLMSLTDSNPEIAMGIFNPLASILDNYEMDLLT